MNEIELKASAWAELVQYTIETTTKRPNELTVDEFAKQVGQTQSSAKWTLKKLEEAGKVRSRIIILDGMRTRVYEPISTSDQ